MKLRAKLATEAIATFSSNVVHHMTPNPPFDVLLATEIVYFADVAPRCTREPPSLRPGVVRLVNDNNVLIVSRTGEHIPRATIWTLEPNLSSLTNGLPKN